MSPTTCPNQQTLQQFLIGKTPEVLREALEEHLTACAECAAVAESLSDGDDLTEALAHAAQSRRSQAPEDEAALQAAISQAKGLASLLDTQGLDFAGSTFAIDADPAISVSEELRSKHNLDFLAPAQQPDELGRLGDYRVLKVLGVGGMGMVFKAEDIRLGRLVALKVMLPKVAVKPQAKERFLREARATAAISHDHVVQIHQVGEDRGVPFIAMQYLQGQSLQAAFTRIKKLRSKDVARIGKEVALGLAAAHEKGLIHRDIKPDNVWVESKTRRVKILDFGLARNMATDEGLTQSGTILGTPRYMAPEQVTGEKVDHRADLFSLGSMLYHLAAGKPAFVGENIPALLYAITQSAPQPLGEVVSGIHPSLADLIMRLLRKEPENRPPSAEEVARELAGIEATLKAPVDNATAPLKPIVAVKSKSSQQRQPPSRRWPVVAAAGAAALALILGVIVITIRGPDGKETTIRVAKGTTTTLDLATGSNVTIQEEAPESTASDAPPEPPALAAGLASNADTSNQSQLTEEELLAAHPPLNEWLVGRKELTVAQDGSAMFTTIQHALDAQKVGEVVRVLDKGPYRERLTWANKKDCGLVTTVGTIIEVRDWVTYQERSNARRANYTFGLNDCRIHGFAFLFDCQQQDDHIIAQISGSGLCIEHCIAIPLKMPPAKCVPQIVFHPKSSTTPFCIRNNVWVTQVLTISYDSEASLSLVRNWLHSPMPPAHNNYFPFTGFTASQKNDAPFQFVFEQNISSRQQAKPFGISSEFGNLNFVFQRNTTAAPLGPVMRTDGKMPGKNWSLQDNLSLVERNSCDFGDDARTYLRDAMKLWNFARNYSNGRTWASNSMISLGDPHASEIRVLSTDPLDRNFMRIDPTTITVPEGDPFPGALPPGPAPAKGDWFTELQDRFKDSLQYMTPEARDHWTIPIELPAYRIDDTTSAVTAETPAEITTTEPPNPTSDEAASTQTTEVKTETSDENPVPPRTSGKSR